MSLQQAITGEPRLRMMRDEDEAVGRLLEIALQIEGLYRHASTHAAGVVIGDRPLIELVPLYRDPRSDYLVTQYSMKHVEQAGLVKFDFLGLTTLTILQRAVTMLHGLGIEVDLDRLPLDDTKTYEMLARGDAGGVFQLEGQGMRDVLRQMRPDRFDDLIAAVALYRPGPMANIPDYCRRKHGENWEAPHTEIHDILAETYGIMVYQEQVMQIAQTMAGYSLGAADLLRRAMGKKIRAEMEAQRETFVQGATGRGIPQAKAVEVFELMAKFADYGFNKSHAAAYALVAYQTAWMKANHAEVFIAACMSLALGNTDRLAALREEALRSSICSCRPTSTLRGRLHGAAHRRRQACDPLCTCRRKKGWLRRHAVVGRGARPTAFCRPCGLRREDRSASTQPDAAREPDPCRRLRHAGEQPGSSFSGCRVPVAPCSGSHRRKGNRPDCLVRRIRQRFTRSAAAARDAGLVADGAAQLRGGGNRFPSHSTSVGWLRQGTAPAGHHALCAGRSECPLGITRVRLAGMVTAQKERVTRTGNRMAWVKISDTSGSCEVTLFAEVLARARDMLADGARVLITADLRLDGEALRITAQDVTSLDQAAANAGAAMRIWLRETASVPHIRDLLGREGRGKGRVILVPRLGTTQSVEIALPGGFNVTPRLAQALKVVPGVDQVEEL